MSLRPYQSEWIGKIEAEWAAGRQNVVGVLPTGGGKTVCIADIHRRERSASVILAHRQPIVSQISLALAREGLRHNLIAAAETRASIVEAHVHKFGRSFFDPAARAAVASVDTIIRAKHLGPWAAQVRLWSCDEGHHLVLDNKWHAAIGLFTHPAVRGLLPTATPLRADGKGLGRAPDGAGVADAIVLGPQMRWLIDQGYLTDYRIICAKSHIEEFLGDVAKSGDWSTASLRSASQKSQIVGDAVDAYLAHARGKLGITFVSDVDTAAEMADRYRAAGVPCEVLTGDTPIRVRTRIIERFERRELLQIVAIDVVSEGFDLPAVEVAIFARPTASLGLYMQQFGRALRPLFAPGFDLNTQVGRFCAIAASPKHQALIIDLVGNYFRHRAPDLPRPWTLSNRPNRRAGASGAIPLRVCLNVTCGKPYEAWRKVCPRCGTPAPPPAARNGPEQVEGELGLLDPEMLAAMRGAVAAIDMDLDEYRQRLIAKFTPAAYVAAHVKNLAKKQAAQADLRQAMSRWEIAQVAGGIPNPVEHERKFYAEFRIDVLSARALGPLDAEALRERIDASVNLT